MRRTEIRLRCSDSRWRKATVPLGPSADCSSAERMDIGFAVPRHAIRSTGLVPARMTPAMEDQTYSWFASTTS
jgi:hypothetical protein